MKKIFTILSVMAVLAQASFCSELVNQTSNGNKELTLEKTISMLIENNLALKDAEQSAQAAIARSKQKAGELLPQIDIQASYTKLSPDPEIAFPGFGTIQFFPEQNYDAHITAKQTLFDFGKKWDSYKAAKYSSEAVQNNTTAVKSNLILQTQYTYYSIILLQKSIEVQEQELNALREYLDITQKKLASGSATSFDVLTIQVKVEEAKNKKVDLENNLTKQSITLRRLICLSDDIPFTVSGELQVQQEKVDAGYFVSLALTQRPELKAARNIVMSSKMQLGSTGSERYPTINLFYEYGYKNAYFPDMSAILENTVAGAQFEMPIFSGFKTYNKVKEAKANYASTQSKEKDIENMVVAEVKQAISDVETNIEKIEAAEIHVKLALEAVTQAKVRFENGVITNLDMINAQTALDEAKLLQLQANFNYIISMDMLKKAAGITSDIKN
ncbi:MAG: TolC family protein [Endomicrobiales bacterium]|nr:TolC family protein [Endomicrobiales bacterium]